MEENPDSTAFYVHDSVLQYSPKALYCLDNKSKLRYMLVKLITNPWFDRILISMIMVYSVLLGMKDYRDNDNSSKVNKFILHIDPYFNVIIYMEFLCKILAMGFIFGENSYLSDGWNWLDFTVVLGSIANEILSMLNSGNSSKGFAALRAFRLLRPLKLLTAIPAMKLLLATLFESVQSLGGIMGLAIFFFTIFSILGVAIWNGKSHYRCYLTDKPVNGEWELLESFTSICSDINPCPSGSFCRSKFEEFNEDGTRYAFNNPDLYKDTDIEDLNFGIVNFDNIGRAFLTIFQVTTMDGWTAVMNLYMDMYNPTFVEFYFICCIIICSFFVLNLTIALMLMKYDEVDQKQEEESETGQNPFEDELEEYAKEIFEEQHYPLIKFIIDNDGIQLDPGATNYLKTEKGFFASFFSKKEFRLNYADPYYSSFLPKLCLDLISHPFFDGGIMCVILLNTLAMSLDKYPQYPEWFLEDLKVLNMIFTVIFTFECSLKLIGLGLTKFCEEGFNNFDLFIVVTSWVQVYFQSSGGKSSGGIFLILRTFRVFRIFKLFKIGDLRMLLDSITFTLSTIGPYVVFLSFCMYIFALIGMSFFAGKIKFDDDDEVDLVNGELPREHFDTIDVSILTIFQVLIGAGWSDIMYMVMRACGHGTALYFISLVIIGGIILLNLFLAIMLGNFDKAKFYGQKKKVFEAFEELMHKQQFRNYTLIEAIDIIMGDLNNYIIEDVLKIQRPKELPLLAQLMKKKGGSFGGLFGSGILSSRGKKEKNNKSVVLEGNQNQGAKTSRENIFGSLLKPQYQEFEPPVEEQKEEDVVVESVSSFHQESKIWESSLFIFHIDWKIRKCCLYLAEPKDTIDKFYASRQLELNAPLLPIDRKESGEFDKESRQTNEQDLVDALNETEDVQSQWTANQIFDQIILTLIIVSSLMLPMENPLNDPNAYSTQVRKKINIFFTCIFLIEANIKIIGKGLLYNNFGTQILPYLADPWNQVDAFVVFISTIDLVLMLVGGGSQLAALKALRALRALRPLRVIKRFENLRLVVNALFSTFGAMQNVLMVGSLLILIFAIMGVSFFKGQFYSCDGLDDEVLVNVFTKQDCLDKGGEWLNAEANFDNSLYAFSTLFQMMTTEGWQEAMWKGIDAAGIDMQPKRDFNPYLAIYFCAYMVIGSLFIMNLFVGVVIDNFNKIKEKDELGAAFVTDTQREWIIYQKIGQKVSFRKKQMEPVGFRLWFFKIVHSKQFENFITLMVVLNTVVMASKFYQMPETISTILKWSNYFFTLIFNMEMIFKLIALKTRYFDQGWNIFDMFIVISADLGVVFDLLKLQKNMSTGVTILRAFRILRIVKLLQKFESIKVIINAVINILPNISNVMSLFVLALFIFACVGINLFATVKQRDILDEKNNFETFGGAMLILMRFSTGEDWAAAMFELAKSEDCKDSQTYDEIQKDGVQGCGTLLSFPFFFSFTIIVTMLILNLTIAAVIDGLQAAQDDNDRLFQSTHIEAFNELWQEYDPKGTGKLNVNDLPFFLVEVIAPWCDLQYLKEPYQPKKAQGYIHNKQRNISIKASTLMAQLRKYKLKSTKSSDGSYVINFANLYKELIKKAFARNDMNKFKLSNQKVKDRLKKGWKKEKGQVNESNIDLCNQIVSAKIIQQAFRARFQRKRAATMALTMDLDEKSRSEDGGQQQ